MILGDLLNRISAKNWPGVGKKLKLSNFYGTLIILSSFFELTKGNMLSYVSTMSYWTKTLDVVPKVSVKLNPLRSSKKYFLYCWLSGSTCVFTIGIPRTNCFIWLCIIWNIVSLRHVGSVVVLHLDTSIRNWVIFSELTLPCKWIWWPMGGQRAPLMLKAL